MISIKDVAKQTGVSVRTLRYYDEISLLKPAGKTEGGHRLYSEKELAKLQEIQFLKTLGFQLKEIKNVFENEQWDWEMGLHNQLNFTKNEKARLTEMEQILTGLLNSLVVDGEIKLPEIQKMIQLYQNNYEQRDIFRKSLFSNDEYELLARLPNMNKSDPDTLEWMALIGKLKNNLNEDPSTIEVQRIVRRIYEKSIEAFGENDAFFERLWEVRSSKEKSAEAGFYPLDDDLLDFFARAYSIFEKNNDGKQEL